MDKMIFDLQRFDDVQIYNGGAGKDTLNNYENDCIIDGRADDDVINNYRNNVALAILG